MSYKGYMIKSHSLLDWKVWIEKDGRLICHANSIKDAKLIINMLTATYND